MVVWKDCLEAGLKLETLQETDLIRLLLFWH
jgi:hypothetical protein